MFTTIMCPLLDNLRFAISCLVLSQMILNTEGQSSYGLLDGATSISATSQHDDAQCEPSDAKYSTIDQCWCSATEDCADDPILTINLENIHKITKVGVMSCSWDEYITSYKLEYYYDGSWIWYNNGEPLTGNDGCCNENDTSLSPPVIATQIRLYPLTAQRWCSTNFEVYGYPWSPTESPTRAPTLRPTLLPSIRAPTAAILEATLASSESLDTSSTNAYAVSSNVAPSLTLSPITISGFVIIVFSWLFGIISIYSLYAFLALKSSQRRQSVLEMSFIKRRANLVVAITSCSIFVLLIGYPAGLLVHWPFEFMAPITSDNRNAIFIILDALHIIDIFVYYLAAVLILLRYWMIYYDIQFSTSCLNLEWKHCITKSKEALHSDKWHIQHRNTLGNLSYMTRIVVFIISCVSLFSMAMHARFTLLDASDVDMAPFISSVVVFTGFVGLIIIWHKMPFFVDKIYLYKEFRILAFFWISVTIVYGCSTIVSRFTNNLVFNFFGHFCAVFMQFIVSFVSTFWVLKYIIKTDAEMVPSCVDTLDEIFSDENRLNLFMQHLISEFSMECLLSVIEFQQYKCAAMKQLNFNLESQEHDTVFLQSHVPQSDIVFKYLAMYTGDDTKMVEGAIQKLFFTNNTANTGTSIKRIDTKTRTDVNFVFKIKAYKLYKKYIEPRSPFEINVCSKTRQKLTDYMEHYDKWVNADRSITDAELVNIFDRANSEMLQFLNYSKSNM